LSWQRYLYLQFFEKIVDICHDLKKKNQLYSNDLISRNDNIRRVNAVYDKLSKQRYIQIVTD